MKTKVIETRLVPEGKIAAITLFGLVFTRDRRLVTPEILNHELIHCCQQLELLYIPFFLLYVVEWLVRLAMYRNHDKAYYLLSFEQEAYRNDHDFSYISRRRPYSWLHYFRSRQ